MYLWFSPNEDEAEEFKCILERLFGTSYETQIFFERFGYNIKNRGLNNKDFFWRIQILFVNLPKECLKKGYNMALKIKNREEAIAVLRDMVQRKKEMEKQVQEEFAKVRKEAENYYATI